MVNGVLCWRCGSTLINLILPLSRREECASCSADQHVCKMCQYFDTETQVQCAEERAEPPGNKEVANFCDYFHLGVMQKTATSESAQARQQLDELFGDAPSGTSAQETFDTEENAEFDPEAELKKLFDN